MGKLSTHVQDESDVCLINLTPQAAEELDFTVRESSGGSSASDPDLEAVTGLLGRVDVEFRESGLHVDLELLPSKNPLGDLEERSGYLRPDHVMVSKQFSGLA